MYRVLIVLAVLALLRCGGGPQKETYAEGVIRRNKQARDTGSDLNIRNIQKAIEDYRNDNDAYPAGNDYTVLTPALTPTYIVVLPERDSWGVRYRYESDGRSYRLSSNGQDGLPHTPDDVVVTGSQ